MSSNYYYIYSSLPDIFFDEKDDKKDYREFSRVFDEVRESLSDPDREALRYVRYPIDNANLIVLLEGASDAERKFLPGGNYSLDELKYEMRALDTIPAYMVLFLENFNRLQVPFGSTNHVDHLNENFYGEVLNLPESGRGFGLASHEGDPEPSYGRHRETFDASLIKRWYIFERDLNNVLTAIECQKHNEPIEKRESVRVDQKMGQHLLGDYETTQALRQSKSYDFSLSGKFWWMDRVLNLNSESMLSYEKALIALRLEVLQGLAGSDDFTLNALLAYFIQLQILIRWSSLDETAGRNFIDTLSQKVGNYIL